MKNLRISSYLPYRKHITCLLAITVFFSGIPFSVSAAISTDIKANDSDGPITISSGDSWSYSWTSSEATACTLTSPSGVSGISLAGVDGPIELGHPWYPTAGNPTTLTLDCTNGTTTSTDSVVINLADVPPPPPPAAISTDIKANDSDGPITISSGDSWSYSWTSSEATACTLTSPSGVSGISLAGVDGPIELGHPWYPTAGNPTTLTLDCTNGTTTSTDSVVINLADVPPPPPPAAISTDIKANDSDGPITISSGDSFTYSWTSSEATACTLTSPSGVSGISLAGVDGPIELGHPWYPTTENPTTLTLNCTNGTTTSTDSVVINLADVPPPPPPPPSVSTGKITFCLILADVNNVIATSSAGLPAGVFSINLATSSSISTSIIQSKTWLTTTLSPNRKYILDDDFDSDCVTYEDLSLGNYYYSSLSVTGSLWQIAKYNDQNTQLVNDISDFFTYDPLNVNSDGLITLSEDNNDQTLVMYDVDDTGLFCPAPQITSPLSATIVVGQSFTYTITASSTTPTTFSALNLPSGFTFDSSTNMISGTSTVSGTFSIDLFAVNTCIGGLDSKVLVLTVLPSPPPPPPPGGGDGGGGGGGGGGSSRPPSGTVLGATFGFCTFLNDYMRRDFNNDPIEVLKLQAFLINFEGHRNVSLTGVFDQATFDAVSAFQTKYFKDILEPWGHTGPTGYVYILTLKKINEIYCQHIYPLNQAQINEIVAFRALLESLRTDGVDVQLPPSQLPETTGGAEEIDTSTTSPPLVPIVGWICPVCSPPQGQNINSLAAVIFAQPDTLLDAVKCLYWVLLILIVLYIIGNVLKNVLYKNIPENNRKRFLTKWLVMDIGLVCVIILALIFNWWCLILPLIIALIISLVWTSLYPEHNSMKASAKSWYLVGSARIKSILKDRKETKKETIKTIMLNETKGETKK